MSGTKIKTLFPEGSSLSARQALTALGQKGYLIDICDPDPFCICRFSKYVNHYFKCPKIGPDPAGYYHFILQLIQKNKYDILLPVHEQAYLFSKNYEALSEFVNLAISDFESFNVLQSKAEFIKFLQKLNIPHPHSQFIKTKAALENLTQYPFYVKLAFGTAGHGTWKVESKNALNHVVRELETAGYWHGDTEILVQEAVSGTLSVVQALFDNGELIAAHCYQLCSEGVGGSASARIGVYHPNVIGHITEIGKRLKWHGSLMLDYIYDEDTATPYYIEANPRPGETMNATLSGFNIAEKLAELSLNRSSKDSVVLKYGVKTHSLAASLLGIASRGGSRKSLLAEIAKAAFKKDTYRKSYEELTRLKDDAYSIVPLVVIIFRLLVHPGSANRISTKAIDNYSVSESTVVKIRKMDSSI